MNSFVLAANFSNEVEARIAQGMLDNNGIESIVEPDSMATLYGAGSTWAPIRLLVRESDQKRALELLEQHRDS